MRSLATCLLVSGLGIGHAHAQVELDPRGRPTTSIAIDVPLFHSITPVVALRYGGAAAPGLAGSGWALDAGSQITRRSATGGLPRNDATDHYLLGGDLLIACAPQSRSPSCTTGAIVDGSSANYFSTETENYRRIRRDPSGASWRMWGRDGTTYDYATADNGATFQLRTVTDTFGNTVAYAWSCAANSCELDAITYGEPGTLGSEVRFYREARPDPYVSRNAAGQEWHGERLRSIVVRNSGGLVRAYQLSYGTSAETRASLLTAVQQFGRDAVVAADGSVTAGATPPLPARTFGAPSQTAAGAWSFAAETSDPALFTIGPGPVLPPHYGVTELAADVEWDGPRGDDQTPSTNGTIIGDFDGDGRGELGTWALQNDCTTIAFRTYLSTGTTFTASLAQPVGTTAQCTYGKTAARTYTGDFNGDGSEDVALLIGSELRRYDSNGLGKFAAGPVTTMPSVADLGECSTVDVDGDGRMDIVCEHPLARTITTQRSTKTGWLASTLTTTAFLPDHTRLTMSGGDVNGDGLGDLLLIRPETSQTRVVIGRSRGDGTYDTSETEMVPYVFSRYASAWIADVDGDAKSDILVGVTGSLTPILSRKGVGTRWNVMPTQLNTLLPHAFADVDGDGRADLVGAVGDVIAVQRATGNGTFGPIESRGVACDPTATNEFAIAPGDWNGDGLADPTCVLGQHDGTTRVADSVSQSQGLERTKWRHADLDGDGKPELVYLQFTNPGYKLHVVSPLTNTRTTFQIDATTTEPDGNRWIIADVGSPAGPADGRDDLVLLEHAGGRLIATTEYGAGIAAPVRFTADLGAAITHSSAGWHPFVDDKDGRMALIRVRPRTIATPGVNIDRLIPAAAGQYTLAGTTAFGPSSVAPMVDRDSGFIPTDLDGDGLTDLVHLDAANGQLTIRTLRASGTGTYLEAVSTVTPGVAGTRAIKPVDLDGDGALDLVHIGRTGAYVPCIVVTPISGDGRGGFATVAAPTGGCVGTAALYHRLLEDTLNVLPLDLDRDGRPELVQVTHAFDGTAQQLVVTTFRRSGQQWDASSYEPALAFDHGDAWSWQPWSDPFTSDSGLSYQHAQVATTLRWRHVTDELTTLTNGTGLATTITYGAYTGARAALPAGLVPRVVTRIERRDLASAIPMLAATTYAYAGATWSHAKGRLLGFATMATNEPTLSRLARYALSDACGARVTSDELRDPVTSALWGYTAVSYVPAGGAPYRCEPASSSKIECERTAACRVAVAHSYGYDDYGNRTSDLSNTASGAQLQTSDSFTPNETAYITNAPSYRWVMGYDGIAWQVLKMSSQAYDNQAIGVAPTRGALTSAGEYDDHLGANVYALRVYDQRGNLILTSSPEGRAQSFAYDATRRLVTQSCDTALCTYTTYDPVLELPVRVRDPNQQDTVTTYDAFGRTSQVTAPNGSFTRTTYLALGVWTGTQLQRQRVRTEVSDTSADGVLASDAFFDGAGRTYLTVREDNQATLALFTDMSKRAFATSLPYRYGTSATYWITPSYDGLGRTVQTQLADGTRVSTTYEVGKTTEVDALGFATVSYLDGAGRRITVRDALGVKTAYHYDALGRLVSIEDVLGNTETHTWSSRDKEVRIVDPDRGQRDFTYDRDARLVGIRDANGNTTAIGYDFYGRIARRDETGGIGARSVRYTYDAGSNPHGTSLGRLVFVDDTQPNGRITDELWYDALGRTTRARRCIAKACSEEATDYDIAGRLATLHYPDAAGALGTGGAEDVAYSYDDAGRVTDVGPYAHVEYDIADRPLSMRMGNGVVTTFAYDPRRGWLDGQKIEDARASQLASLRYTHDAAGHIITSNGEDALKQEMRYEYDALGRLRHVDSFTDLSRAETFRYDELGRMTYSDELGDTYYQDAAHVHAMTRSDRGAARSYDANGNVVDLTDPSGRQLALAWTADDKLALATGPQGDTRMTYDQAGRRVMKSTGGTTTRYFSARVEREGKVLVKNYLLGARAIARDTDATLRYLHEDVRRDIRLVTDTSGSIVDQRHYSAFGKLQAGSGAIDLGFAAARPDRDLGLVTMGARTYDPTSGQFLSPDSVIPSLVRPQALNRYAYVENDPINHYDPSGHLRMQIEYRKERIEQTPGISIAPQAWESPEFLPMHAWEEDEEVTEDDDEDDVVVDPEAVLEDTTGNEEVITVDEESLFLAEDGALDAPSSAPVAFDFSKLVDDLMQTPFTVFGFNGGEAEVTLAKGAGAQVKLGAEVVNLVGVSQRGFYQEGIGALGGSLEWRSRGRRLYGAGYTAVAVDEKGNRHPGVLAEGGYLFGRKGGLCVGVYGFDLPGVNENGILEWDAGLYVGIKDGHGFYGAGASFDTFNWWVNALSITASDVGRALFK